MIYDYELAEVSHAEYTRLMSILGVPLEDWQVVRARMKHAEKIPERPVHFTWLHGPADE